MTVTSSIKTTAMTPTKGSPNKAVLKRNKRTKRQNGKHQRITVWREAVHESVAGVTDSMFTQFLLTICYFLYTKIDLVPHYVQSGSHIYWLFPYFLHLNILDTHIWGHTFRNSLAYIFAKPKQRISRTLFIVLCQYISIFAGAWISIQCMEYIFREDPTRVTQLKHTFVGKPDRPNTFSFYLYIQYILQTVCFQLADRFVSGIIATFSPLIKRKTFLFDGKWTQIILRMMLAHYLIVSSNAVGIIINPNYGFYATLYYRRWSTLDMIILILPYVTIPIWNATFAKLSILHNPSYFKTALATKKKKTQ